MAGDRSKIPWPQLMETMLTAEGSLGSTYNRFHDYSPTNLALFFMQGLHEAIASGSRWKSLDRTPKPGARRYEVSVPRMIQGYEPDPDDPDKRKRVERLVGFQAVRAVYTLSDTEGADLAPRPVPGWDEAKALEKLGIRRVPFEHVNGNLQGYSHGLEVAVNP